MKIVILGGSGYLGSKILQRIYRKNKIYAIIRNTDDSEKLKQLKSNIEFIDISCLDKYEINDIDLFINVAGVYPRNCKGEFEIFDANFINPLKCFLWCQKQNLKKVITIGTALPDNFNSYSLAKAKFLETILWYTQNSNGKTQVINIRLENFYGIDEPLDRFIPFTISRLCKNESLELTSGEQMRDFVNIDDVVNNLIYITNKDFNEQFIDLPIGTGDCISIKELTLYLKILTESNSQINFGVIPLRKNEPSTQANAKIMEKYGLTFSGNIKKDLKKFVKEFMEKIK